MSSKLTLALIVTAVLMTSIVAVTIPSANALTARTNFNDSHCTAYYNCGQKICGDHLCAPGEYDQYQKAISQAQMNAKNGMKSISERQNMNGQNMTGQNMPAQNMTGQNMPATNTSTQYANAGTSTVCQTVQITLTTEGTSPATIAKLLAALGCR